MWITTTISIIAILLAYISQNKTKGKYFEIGFILLTITASIQYGYGTDYMRYYELWKLNTLSDVHYLIDNYFNQSGWTEPGWMLLNALFGFENGFFILVALISIVENYIYYRLIKNYVPLGWRWLAVFLYVGMDNLYLLNFSMLRQGLTVALFVAAVMLMNKKKLLPAIVLVFFSLTIHLSSAVCVPFLVLYFLPLKKTNFLAAILLIFTFVIFVFKEVVISGLNLAFTFEELAKYSGYGQRTLSSVGIGYFLLHIPNIVILYLLFTDLILREREQKMIALLAFSDMLITPLMFYGAGIAGRLGIYFMAFRVAAIPLIYGSIKERVVQLFLVLISIFTTFVMYIQFFQSYNDGYTEDFKTIFSVI